MGIVLISHIWWCLHMCPSYDAEPVMIDENVNFHFRPIIGRRHWSYLSKLEKLIWGQLFQLWMHLSLHSVSQLLWFLFSICFYNFFFAKIDLVLIVFDCVIHYMDLDLHRSRNTQMNIYVLLVPHVTCTFNRHQCIFYPSPRPFDVLPSFFQCLPLYPSLYPSPCQIKHETVWCFLPPHSLSLQIFSFSLLSELYWLL